MTRPPDIPYEGTRVYAPQEETSSLPSLKSKDLFQSINDNSIFRRDSVRKFIYIYLTKGRDFVKRAIVRANIYHEIIQKICYNNKEVPSDYKDYGHPVLIPGTMGTASYVMAGQSSAIEETFGSTAHGAGRVMSRHKAKKVHYGEDVVKTLKQKGILIKAASMSGVAEEAPGAYKDIDEVAKVSDEAGIAKRIARLTPIGVVKG